MREYELPIEEALRNGLSPLLTTPINASFLHECKGFRIGKGGTEAFPEGVNPLPAALDIYYSWPFPKFVQGEGYNFLIIRDSTVNHEDSIYSVSDDMATVVSVFSVDALTFGIGTLMEVADFGEYAILVNGVATVFWNVAASGWNAQLATATIPLMRTICNFKGQAVGGAPTTTWYGCDETFYIWSKIGSIDFTPEGDNEAGYRRCPYGGTVYHTRRMGGRVVGYSSKGVTFMTPVSEPAPTFGFEEMKKVGLVNRGAVDGSFDRQVYVGEDLIVREVTKEGVKDLGFKTQMDLLAATGEDIIVSYDKSNKDFFISNGEQTFLLSPKGMSELPQHPSTVWRVDPDNVYMLPDTVDDYYPTITTEAIDFGYSGDKTISTVETDAVLMEDPEAAVVYGDNATAFTSTDYVPINHQGVATIPASANMFRFSVRFSDIFDTFRISYIKARYKMTDLRSIRGVYAPPLRGQ